MRLTKAFVLLLAAASPLPFFACGQPPGGKFDASCSSVGCLAPKPSINVTSLSLSQNTTFSISMDRLLDGTDETVTARLIQGEKVVPITLTAEKVGSPLSDSSPSSGTIHVVGKPDVSGFKAEVSRTDLQKNQFQPNQPATLLLSMDVYDGTVLKHVEQAFVLNVLN